MKRTVLYLGLGMLILSAPHVRAQAPKVHTGIEALVSGKIPIIAAGGTSYGLWGNARISMVNIIEGTEENALALRNRIGFSLDIARYHIQGLGSFAVDRASLVINPEIMLPTGLERLKWMAGIGVEWNNYFLAQLQNSSAPVDQELIGQARRKLLPFLSAGIEYQLHMSHDFRLQLFIRQMLLDAFRENTALYLRGNKDKPDLKLNHQPSYLGFGFTYFF